MIREDDVIVKIFLCGDTGRLNRGCEAIVRGTTEVLGNEELYLASFAPNQNIDMVKELGISMISYASHPTKIHRIVFSAIRRIFKNTLVGFGMIQRPLFRKMSTTDLSLNIGGDTYCYQRPAVSMALNKYTYRKGIKNILWCCSIEKNKIQGEILKDLCKYKYIFAREQITVDNLKTSGVPAEKIVKVCDPAFFLKKKEVNLPDGFQIGNTVGINLSDCVCYGPYKKAYDNTKYLIDWILSKTDMSVCLVPHVYSISDSYHHDWPILKRLHEEIGNKRVVLIDKEYDCEQLKYIISNCRFFVGARTHSTIAAYSSKIPTLVIGYSVKSKGIATDLFGTYENFVLPFEELKEDDELLIAFKQLMQNEEAIKKRYEEILPNYMQQLIDAVNKYIRKDVVDIKGYICDKEQCTGCSLCYNVCTQNCIEMKENEEGFLYPVIDESLCINCGKCKNICPVRNKPLDDGKKPLVFGVKNLDDEVRRNSSSGGVFKLIAEEVMSSGGVVFAPSFDDCLEVRTAKIEKIEDLVLAMGSKYVQSRKNDCYKEVLDCLEQGKSVLFSGTPCEIAGLKAFLKRDYENLLTQDIVCHGVPSPKSLRNYLSLRMKKAKADSINKVTFRKKMIDGCAAFEIEFDNGVFYLKNHKEDTFMKSYLSNLNIRSSCLECSFKQIHRQADITLGDFWGVETICSEFDDKKGVSLVLIHSEKGKAILERISNKLEISTAVFDTAINNNSSYIFSTKANAFRKSFLTKNTKKNFEKLVKRYSGTHLLAKVVRTLKRLSY